MGNLYGGVFIIAAAAAYWIIFGSIFIQPGLSLNPAHDDVVKPAAERKYTPSLGTKSAAPPAEVEKKKKPDAGQLVVPKSKPKSSMDQAKSLSPPNKDSWPDDQSKSKLKSANAEQHHKHKHHHHHKHKNKQKEGRSSKLNPNSGTKKDISRSPWPKRSASPPKQARESSSLPKTITPAPTKATKKLDNQSSKKTPKSSSSSATHERPVNARAPAS